MTNQDLQQQYEAVRQVWEQVLDRYREAFRKVSEAFRPLVEWAQTPEGQAALAEVGGGSRYCPKKRKKVAARLACGTATLKGLRVHCTRFRGRAGV